MLQLNFNSSLGTSVSSALCGRCMRAVSVWTLTRRACPTCNKQTRTMISKPLLLYLGRVMLSFLLGCLFNEYVATCLGKWYLGPPFNLPHDLCCKPIPLSHLWLLHYLVDWILILCITWRHAGDIFWLYYAITLYVYFSEMSTHQQRMMLKIIQINSFLFLLIRASPVSWMTVNRLSTV